MIRIFKTSLSSSSDSPEGLTTELGQQTSPGRRGFGPKSSGHRSPGGGASVLANKRLTLPFLALLAVLTAGLLFLLPGGPLHAQEAMTELEYAENDTDPVATFTAVDPEGRMIYWDLVKSVGFSSIADVDIDTADVADDTHFTITSAGGAATLNFRFPPDYEMPRGMAMSNDNTNTYKVVIVAADDAPGAVEADDEKKTYYKLTVMVTDMDEDGMVSLSAQQPQVEVALNAMLTDDDATDDQITAAKWRWYHAAPDEERGLQITGENAAMYMPAEEIVGRDVWAVATYKDRHGDKTAKSYPSANPVRAAPPNNAAPTFPDSTDTRSVNENSPPGTAVGKPVKAGDAGDVLTYTLSGTDDDDMYTIDRATGQIMVGPRTMLDAEPADDATHTVTVRATDPFGDPDIVADVAENSDEVTVTITIKDVHEAPMVTGGPTKIEVAEATDDTKTIDLNPDEPNVQAPTYMATDPEIDSPSTCTAATTDEICKWSLTGPDAADLEISNMAADFGQLSFKKAPDYEKPIDADMDNMYMVTVVVTDSGKNKLTATRDVVIQVTNADEDGSVTYSSVQPLVGVPFTATLSDPEGMTTDVKWQWWRTTDDDGASPGTPFPDAEEDDGTRTGWEKIDDAKTDTYKPVSDDINKALAVVATYTDPKGSGKSAPVAANTTNTGRSVNAVAADMSNRAPQFKDGDVEITVKTIRVDENTKRDDDASLAELGYVGVPVKATDPNGSDDILTYTLSGVDASLFDIISQDDTATTQSDEEGQIRLKAGTKLDYESNKKTYMVTVTARDPSNAEGSIDVTIKVVDVDEPPEFTAPSEGDVDKTIKENSRGMSIYTFRATDPEGRKVYWSLSTETDSPHSDQFTISDKGVLSLRESPDYEATGDEALGDDGQYVVVVVASDDAPGAGIGTDPGDEDPVGRSMKTVTLTVENVDEPGTITVDRKGRYIPVGSTVTATLNEDGTTSSVEWKWTANGEVVGTNSTSYTPQAGDHNKTLRVEVVEYTEGNEGGKSIRPITVGTVKDESNEAPEDGNTGRMVDENARVGTSLGASIQTTDPNGDSLTYTVDNPNFSISSSGQLRTAAILNHEALPDGEVDVPVTATDPYGNTGTITVTVTVDDVNEAPMITTGITRRDHAENTATDDTDGLITTYVASDIDEGDDVADLAWTVEGDDAAMFDMGESNGTLRFKDSPNFEMPMDRNKDNVYKVTVVVSDDGDPKLTDKRQVEITVTDMAEPGMVMLSAVQPKVGIDLKASLTDPDNVTSANAKGTIEDGVKWQWWRTTANDAGTAPVFPDTGGATAWEKITDAKTDTYKPIVADAAGTDGKWLVAQATYTDRRGPGQTMHQASANAVIINRDNMAPVFKENDREITETTRYVLENTEDMDNVVVMPDGTDTAPPNTGDPDPDRVGATDPNDDNLTYNLGGADMASFSIGRTNGQLSTKAKLDYETKSSYMVTVTATDPRGLSDSVDVTIMVVDDNEAPEVILGGLAISGRNVVDYAENGMGAVGDYNALGPDAADATWGLSGADAGAFSISSAGVLTFMAPPNYESPADANTDNTYMVMVTANDGTNDAMKTVSVRVTNEEETGEVTLWDGMVALTMAPQVGDTITGAVMDPDGGVMDESWQWSRTTTPAMMDSWMPISGETNAAYMVAAGDTGYYLRVMATYTDAAGTDMGYSSATMMVGAEAVDTLFGRYDANDNNEIDLDEVFKAIDDYFDYDDRLTLEEVYEIVDLYFES